MEAQAQFEAEEKASRERRYEEEAAKETPTDFAGG